jgi:hypothetical protein
LPAIFRNRLAAKGIRCAPAPSRLRIGEGAASPLFGEGQIVGLRSNQDAGCEWPIAGRAAAGVCLAGLLDRDGTRAPYPGSLAFEKADAAVYFGPDAAVQVTREPQERLQGLGGARLVVVPARMFQQTGPETTGSRSS